MTIQVRQTRSLTTSLNGLAAFAEAVNEPGDPIERLQRGAEHLTTLINACVNAGITCVSQHGTATEAASSDLVWQADRLQYDLGGPCLDVTVQRNVVVSNDLQTEQRWPLWTRAAIAQFAIPSIMSLLLHQEHKSTWVLNLYGAQPDCFTGLDLAIVQASATQLAIAFLNGRQIEQLGTAMTTRTVIGQAQGILMERYKIDAARAFDVLRRISQHDNTKLGVVAQQLVTHRDLPGLHQPIPARHP